MIGAKSVASQSDPHSGYWQLQHNTHKALTGDLTVYIYHLFSHVLKYFPFIIKYIPQKLDYSLNLIKAFYD